MLFDDFRWQSWTFHRLKFAEPYTLGWSPAAVHTHIRCMCVWNDFSTNLKRWRAQSRGKSSSKSRVFSTISNFWKIPANWKNFPSDEALLRRAMCEHMKNSCTSNIRAFLARWEYFDEHIFLFMFKCRQREYRISVLVIFARSFILVSSCAATLLSLATVYFNAIVFMAHISM